MLNPITQLLEARLNPPVLPVVLQELTLHQKGQIADTLSNNEVSSDEEIIELWTTECGIPQEAALAAMKFRSEHFLNPFYVLFPELHTQ